MRNIGVFFNGQFVPVLCKIGVKMAENVFETPQNRGQILGCGTIMVTPLNIELRHRDLRSCQHVYVCENLLSFCWKLLNNSRLFCI